MYMLVDEKLRIETEAKIKPEKRDLYVNMLENINEKDQKVTIISGLRRTGKSTMMFQAINELGYENCAYIYCEKAKMSERKKYESFDCISDLKDKIEEANIKKEKKYIFVDEATRLVDFVSNAAVIPDLCASENCRIVMTGTESLGFILAKKMGNFTDRTHLIHTTYIPYHEWNRLLGKNLSEYIRYGGTLDPEGTFYNDEVSTEYLDTAIVNNFLFPLEHMGYSNAPKKLYQAYKNNELVTYIQRMVDMSNEEFLIGDDRIFKTGMKDPDLKSFEYLREDFDESANYSDLIDVLTRRGINTHEMIAKQYEFMADFRKALRIHNRSDILEAHLDNELLRELKKYMIEIEMIAPKNMDVKGTEDESYYFVQPGMRYSQCKMLIESAKNVGLDTIYNKADWYRIEEIYKEITEGKLMEDILFTDILRDEGNSYDLNVYKFRRVSPLPNGEFDIVISDYKLGKSIVLEVKHSSDADEGQTKHLLSESFCKNFEAESGTKIIYKAVIYNGSNGTKFGVDYINSEDFLLRNTGRLLPLKKNKDLCLSSEDVVDITEKIAKSFHEISTIQPMPTLSGIKKEELNDVGSSESKNSGSSGGIKACLDESDISAEKDLGDERDDI